MGPENRLADHQRNRHRMGYPMHYNNTVRSGTSCGICARIFYGATYEKMGELGYVMWPCRDESDADRDLLSV